MQRTFFVVFAAAVALLIGAALPNLGTAQASSVLTASAKRTAVVALAGSVNVAPITLQTQDGFVRETSPLQASQVLTKLGNSAVWTYNPKLRVFQQLANTTPKIGSAIYVKSSVSATIEQLTNPTWAATVAAHEKAQQTPAKTKAHGHSATGKAAVKVSKTAKTKAVVKPAKVAPAVHKTSVTTTTNKSTVVASSKTVTKTQTPVKKATTVTAKTPVKKATTSKTPVKKTKTTTKPVTQTTTPATTTVPPTTVAAAPTTTTGTMAAPAGYSASQLEFNETASGSSINPAYWNTFLTSNAAQGAPWNTNGSGGSTPAGSSPNYDAEYDLPGQITESNGVIDIRATETPTPGFIGNTPTVFPFASGALSSYGRFQFDGGYLQVEAKMPAGAGMWPALWMLPGPGGTSGDNYEIDLFEGGADDGGPGTSSSDMFSWHLHTPSGTVGADTNTNVNLTTSFNTYGLKWIPGQSITWYLNGNVIGTITSAQASIPNEPMELLVNLEVANSNASEWHSVYNSSTPTVNDMLISGVQVYS
jgi:beta-glucanase (GH16 family)